MRSRLDLQTQPRRVPHVVVGPMAEKHPEFLVKANTEGTDAMRPLLHPCSKRPQHADRDCFLRLTTARFGGVALATMSWLLG
jgi:hypothetical protein